MRSPIANDQAALLIDTAGQHPAVNHQQVTGYEAGGIGSEEHRRAYQLVELAEPLKAADSAEPESTPAADESADAARR